MLEKDKFFAKAVLEKGFITREILNQCFAYLQNNPQQMTVQDYLHKQGFITLAQITIILKELQSSQFGLSTDRYQVLEKIGQGGMGSVYKVQDMKLQRIVALKTISLNNDQNGEQRFLREARVMASLKHPNILNIIDLGVHENGCPYFTMDYIEGQTLAEKRFSFRRAVSVIIEVCKAMQYAHDKGIVHRDLKPSNIMILNNTPIVMDFGLAKINYDDKKLSKTGAIIGTVQYMPPEQALGRNADIDHCSDVYSIGAVLFYLLAGKAPFAGGSSISVIFQLTQEQIKFPPSKRIPQQLQNICLKAMAKDKKDRYQSATEFAQDLENFLEGKNVLAHKQRRITQLKRSVVMLFILCNVLLGGWFLYTKFVAPQSISQLRTFVKVLKPQKFGHQIIEVDKPSFHIDLEIKRKTSVSLWVNNKETVSISPRESLQIIKERVLLAYGTNDIVIKLWYDKKWTTIYKAVAIYSKKSPSVIGRNNIYKAQKSNKLIDDREEGNICSPVGIFNKTLYTCYRRKNKDYELVTFKKSKSSWLLNLDSQMCSTPFVVDNLLYFGTKAGSFYCLNVENDNIIVNWKVKLSKESLVDAPIFSNGLIYVSDGLKCYAFAMSTGEKKWEVSGQQLTSPTIFGEKLYIGDSQKMYALNKENGNILWQISAKVHSTPNVTNKRIFYHSSTQAHALDLQGKTLWTSSLKKTIRERKFYGSALVYKGLVYWSVIAKARGGNIHSEIYAFDNQKGNIKWQTILEVPVQSSLILVEIENQNLIFAPARNGFLYAIDSIGGEKILQYRLYYGKKKITTLYTPVICDEKIYIPSNLNMQIKSLSHFLQKHQVTEIEENSIEAEHFSMAKRFIKDMNHWGGWSNGKQCLWKNSVNRKSREFKFFVQETGRYQIKLHLTLNMHYGKFNVIINGSRAPEFDLYREKKGFSIAIKDIGEYQLRKGKNSFFVSCVGRNDKAKSYRFGLDKIIVTPIKQKKITYPPVLYLPFNKDFNDHSNSNNKITNKNVILATGKKGKCAQFDGKSHLSIPDNPRINFRQKFTFSSWFYHKKITHPLPVLSKLSINRNPSYELIFDNQIPDLTLCFPTPYSIVPTQFVLPQKEWYMFTVTYNGGKAKFYLNGKWKNSILFRSTLPASYDDLFIGGSSNSTEKFIGKMDELYIFDRVLNSEEVKNLYLYNKVVVKNN
ncbi:protein kinase [Candidatus Uabimicrobium sp. HlEnr_7]|uniref:protein kinase domain-containing protein n=1 Tax=Candidatus Uabimicrobium helgolandensis TaxID=3095367 RepID=UPI003557501B